MTSPFHYDALLVTCNSERTERRDAIRELGSTIYAEHGTTAALREYMEVTVDMRPAPALCCLPISTQPLMASATGSVDRHQLFIHGRITPWPSPPKRK